MQQMSAVIGDLLYTPVLNPNPDPRSPSSRMAPQMQAAYLDLYLGDVNTHQKPKPSVCTNAFPPIVEQDLGFSALIWRRSSPSSATTPQPAAASGSDACGGNCPNGCSSCPCGSSPVFVDIDHWCNQGSLGSGWNGTSCACIASAASERPRCSPLAHHQSHPESFAPCDCVTRVACAANAAATTQRIDGTFDLGLFQTSTASAAPAECDAAGSVAAAVKVARVRACVRVFVV